MIVLYSRPGSDLHSMLCDAFLVHHGWCTVEDGFYEVLTMTPGHGPGGRYTRWTLREAPAGQA